MIEKRFEMVAGNDKCVEKVIQDENLHYIHMIFNNGEGLPEHFANSVVYMTVLRGVLSIQLDEQDVHEYKAGNILKIPFKTKMNVRNFHEETLELIVVKSPAPR